MPPNLINRLLSYHDFHKFRLEGAVYRSTDDADNVLGDNNNIIFSKINLKNEFSDLKNLVDRLIKQIIYVTISTIAYNIRCFL